MPTYQILKTPSGEELVVVPKAEFDRLAALAFEAEEEAADLAAYDMAKAKLDMEGAQILPADLTSLLLKYRSRLGAVRRWRGLSQAELAAKAGIRQGYLSDLENKRRQGAPETIESLAKSLDVPMAWIA